MINTVLVTAATANEMECMDKVIAGRFENMATTLISGIGPVSTVYAVMNYLTSSGKPDLIINIGIAGSYTENFPVGTVVIPVSDRFADLGMCDGDKFIPISRADMNNIDDNYTPAGIFHADKDIVRKLGPFLSPVKAVTVSTATGSAESREKIRAEYNPDIESMEGAAVYYVCNKQDIPCIGIRSISNMVGPRNKSLWDIELALEQLEKALVNYLHDMVI
jgi:futalosine hydrolase